MLVRTAPNRPEEPGLVAPGAAPSSGPASSPGPASARAVEASVLLVVLAQVAFTPYAYLQLKMLVVLVAAVLVAVRRDTYRSPLLVPATAWVLAAGVATAAGVDRWQSLMGREDQPNGLILVAASAVLLLAGTRAAPLAERLSGWLVWAGIAVAAISMAAHFRPGLVQAVFGHSLGVDDAGIPPLGHPVFIGAFLAAAAAATVPLARRRPVAAVAAMVVMASGLSVTGKRGVLLAAALGLGVAAARSRLPRARVAALFATLALVVGAWTIVDATIRPPDPLSAGRRFDELLTGSAKARPYVWSAAVRAWAERPVTGWGPANTWGATMTTMTEREARVTGRVFTDAHNLVAESLVTTGAIGAAALLALLAAAGRRARRGPPALGWVAGAVVALGVHHMLQSVHVSVTPLFFLLLGLAGAGVAARNAPAAPGGSEGRGRRRARGGSEGRRRRDASATARGAATGARWAIVAVLAVALPLSGLRFAATWLEQRDRRYLDPSFRGVRAALRLEPRRLSAATFLARQRGFDGRHDPEAAREARALARRFVREHPWELNARLFAAQVEVTLREPARAATWLEEHLRLFPFDAWALSYRGFVAQLAGDEETARRWFARSLAIEPRGPATDYVERRPLFWNDV